MNDWRDALYRELDEWNFAGVAATLWWRDDDAQAPSPALDHALALARRFDAPLALAVIPEGMDSKLPAHLESAGAEVTVLQHGFAHRNHAPPGMKKMELGAHRPAAEVHRELAAGFAALKAAFGARAVNAVKFVPALTPPWNRITAELLPGLAGIGFTGVSTFGARASPSPAPGVRAVNTHADIIDWKGGRRFIGAEAAAAALVAHLQARRLGQADDAEPTGLLTHHLVHDAAAWEFLDELFAALDEHPAVKWLSAGAIFSAHR